MNRLLACALAASTLFAGCLDFDAAYSDCFDSARCKQTDAPPPTVTSTVPANRADAVAPDTAIAITFDKAMDPASVKVTLTPQRTLVAPTWNSDGTSVTLTPETSLAYATSYTLHVEGNATDGTKLAPTDVATFTTKAAPTGPKLVSSSPANGASLVALDAGLTLTFDAPVNTTTFLAGTNPAIFLGTPQWTTDNLSVTFPSAASYLANTTYTINFSGKGMDGLDIVASSPPLTFSTVTDITPPTVQATMPVGGATNVSVSIAPSITFSEQMLQSSVLSSVTMSPDGGCQWTMDPTGTILNCTHPAPFAEKTPYTVTVTTGATDLAGNKLQSTFTLQFQTGLAPDVTPPTVQTTTPSDTTTGVDPGKPLVVTFSEPMDPASAQTAISITSPTGITPVGFSWSTDGTQLSFSLSPLPAENTNVSWSIGTGAKDTSGNALANPVTRTFKTWRSVTQTLTSVAALDGMIYKNNGGMVAQPSTTSATVGITNAPEIDRAFLSFDMTPVFSDAPIAFVSADLNVAQASSVSTYTWANMGANSDYSPFQQSNAPAYGPVIAENVEYGTTLDGPDFSVPAISAGGTTTILLSHQDDEFTSGQQPHSANVLSWFTTQFAQWDGSAASADRYIQFRVRCTNEPWTTYGNITYGRVSFRVGESSGTPMTSLVVTYYAP